MPLMDPIVSNSSMLNFPGCFESFSDTTPLAEGNKPPRFMFMLLYCAGPSLMLSITTWTSSSESDSEIASVLSAMLSSLVLVPFSVLSAGSFGSELSFEWDSSSGSSPGS